MTKKELKELIEKNQIDVKFGTIQEVENFLNGWDFFGFLNYDWHEKDEKKESDRYYSVMIRRQQEEEAPEEDNYLVHICAYAFNGIWVINGDYSEVINYWDLLEIIDGQRELL